MWYDMTCHVMSCHVMTCHVMSCHVMSWHVVTFLCHDFVTKLCHDFVTKIVTIFDQKSSRFSGSPPRFFSGTPPQKILGGPPKMMFGTPLEIVTILGGVPPPNRHDFGGGTPPKIWGGDPRFWSKIGGGGLSPCWKALFAISSGKTRGFFEGRSRPIGTILGGPPTILGGVPPLKIWGGTPPQNRHDFGGSTPRFWSKMGVHNEHLIYRVDPKVCSKTASRRPDRHIFRVLDPIFFFFLRISGPKSYLYKNPFLLLPGGKRVIFGVILGSFWGSKFLQNFLDPQPEKSIWRFSGGSPNDVKNDTKMTSFSWHFRDIFVTKMWHACHILCFCFHFLFSFIYMTCNDVVTSLHAKIFLAWLWKMSRRWRRDAWTRVR